MPVHIPFVIKPLKGGWRRLFKWQHICLACMRPWVSSPAPHEPLNTTQGIPFDIFPHPNQCQVWFP